MKKLDSFLLQKICIIYNVVWAISPIMGYGTIYRVLSVLASVLWLLLEAFRPNNIFVKPSLTTISILVFIGIQVILKLIFPDSTTFLAYFQLYIFYLFGLMGESLLLRGAKATLPVLWTILLLMPVWMITTDYGVLFFEGEGGETVSRIMAKSNDEARKFAALGIGGYGMTYYLVMATPCFIYLLRNFKKLEFIPESRRLTLKTLLYINVIGGYITIFLMDYVFAIFFALISLMFLLLYDVNSLVKKSMMLLSVTLSFVLVPYLIIKYINQLAELLWGTSLHRKLVDIQVSLISGKSSGTVYDRVERYERSWNYFLENPLFGTQSFDNIGKHSHILDFYAQYGFVGGSLFLFTIFYVIKVRSSLVKSNIHLVTGISLFLILLTNTLAAQMGVALYLVYSFSVSLVNIKSSQE